MSTTTTLCYTELSRLKAKADFYPLLDFEEEYLAHRKRLLQNDGARYYEVVSHRDWQRLYFTFQQIEKGGVTPIVKEHLEWSVSVLKEGLRQEFFSIEETLKQDYGTYTDAVALHLKDSHRLVAIDRVDAPYFEGYSAYLSGKNYAACRDGFVHRQVAEAAFGDIKGKEIDHVNQNTFDAKRANLRPCSRSENCRNRRAQSNNASKTGLKGVAKYGDYYRAQIALDGKTKCIGFFDTPEQAALAYDVFARKFHAGYGIVNFPDATEEQIAMIKMEIMSNKTRRGLSSKYYGVCWHKEKKCWRGDIRDKKQHYFVGYFDDEIEAAKAVDEVLLKIGRRSSLNFGKTEDDVITMEATRHRRTDSI